MGYLLSGTFLTESFGSGNNPSLCEDKRIGTRSKSMCLEALSYGTTLIYDQQLITTHFNFLFFNFQSSVKGLELGGLSVTSITDVTPIPHNGCKPRKVRRL